MTLCTDIDAAVIKAVDESIVDFFKTMLGAEVTKSQQTAPVLDAENQVVLQNTISTLVGLSGDMTGAICLSMNESVALAIVHELIGHECESIDQTVVDGVGEVGNIVVGGSKRRLSDSMKLQMSLPTVMLASHERVLFPASARISSLHYRFQNNDFVVLVGVST